MDVAGRYRLVRSIGRGGMAEVFEAVAEGEDGFRRRVAVKRMLPDDAGRGSFARMFLDEARIASQLHHANIVAVLDYGLADGAPFQVLEYVDGADADRLADLADAAGEPMPVTVALYLCAEVAHALSHAHEACDADGVSLGIVHRDVSPSNVLVSWTGDVKLSDFGIALAHNRREQTLDGVAKGKLLYMSPEQATRGALDGRADVFSLGCVLHALVAGQSPLAGEGVLTDFIATGVLPLAPALPADVRAIVDRATAAARAARYESARAMAEALGRALARRLEKDPRSHVRRWLDAVRPRAAPARGALDALLDLELVLSGPVDGATDSSGARRFHTGTIRSLAQAARDTGPTAPDDPRVRGPDTDASGPQDIAAPSESPRASRETPRPTRGRAWVLPALLGSTVLAAAGLVAALRGEGGAPRTLTAPAADRAHLTDGSVRLVVVERDVASAGDVAGIPGAAHVADAADAPQPAAAASSSPATPAPRQGAAPIRRLARGTTSAPAAPVTPALALPDPPSTQGTGAGIPAVLVVGGAGAQRGEIVIDGVSRGYAPRSVTLAPGSHLLHIRLPDGRTLGPETIVLTARDTPSSPLRRIYP